MQYRAMTACQLYLTMYSLRDPLRGSLCSPAGKTSDPTSLAYQYETRSYFWGPMGHLKHFGGPKGDLWGTSEALWGTYGALWRTKRRSLGDIQGTFGHLWGTSRDL